MKVRITEGQFHGRPCIRCWAQIEKAKKLGIHRSYEKTWKVYPEIEMRIAEVRPMMMAEANRWRNKIMSQIFNNNIPLTSWKEIELL